MGQKLHTNLIVVRLRLDKQVQFEIAAYPNKVQEWRAGMCASKPRWRTAISIPRRAASQPRCTESGSARPAAARRTSTRCCRRTGCL